MGFNYTVFLLFLQIVVEEAIKIMTGACMCYESVPCDPDVVVASGELLQRKSYPYLIETWHGGYELEKGPFVI